MDVDRVARNIKFKQLSQKDKEFCLLDEFQKVIERINLEYVRGTIDFISMRQKDLYRNYQRTENTLNLIWEECLKGNKPFTLFLDLTEQYYSLIVKGVKLYKGFLDAQHQSQNKKEVCHESTQTKKAKVSGQSHLFPVKEDLGRA